MSLDSTIPPSKNPSYTDIDDKPIPGYSAIGLPYTNEEEFYAPKPPKTDPNFLSRKRRERNTLGRNTRYGGRKTKRRKRTNKMKKNKRRKSMKRSQSMKRR